MAERDQFLLRRLVTTNRERKMAQKTHDAGLIKAAEARLAQAWKAATEHVAATTMVWREPRNEQEKQQ